MDISFKKIISEGLSNLSKSFKFDKYRDESMGIDIGSSTIKIVRVKKKNGKAVLENYGSLSLGPYNNTEIGTVTNLQVDTISTALIDLLKELNITSRSCTISIPSLSSLIFTISIPGKLSDVELSQVVPLEAHKYIPVPISEVTLDWFAIPGVSKEINKDKDSKEATLEKIEVLVVAIHNDTLSKYQDILLKTGLQSESFEIDIFSSIRSSVLSNTDPILFIDFGASKTKVYIVEYGIVKIFHIINRGSSDITRNISQAMSISFDEAEKLKRFIGLDPKTDPKLDGIIRLSVDYIFSDVNSIVFDFEKKYNIKISKMFLLGGGSLLKGFLETAQQNFKMTVSYSNPFSKTECPVFLESTLKNNGPEFAIAVGLALRKLS